MIPKLLRNTIEKLSETGLPEKTDGLVGLRARFINWYHLLYIVGTLFMMVVRFIEGDNFAAIANFALIPPLVVSYWICHRGRHQIALHFIFHILMGLSLFAFYHGSETHLLVFCISNPILAPILCHHRMAPYYYYSIAVLLFFLFLGSNVGANFSFTITVTICFVISLKSMTFLKRTYQDLSGSLKETSLALQSKEEMNQELLMFNQVLAHDLQTPLRSINGFSQLLKENLTDQRTEVIDYLRNISSASTTMNQMIQDLLQYVQLDQVDEEYMLVDLTRLIKMQVQSIEKAYPGTEVQLHCDDLPYLRAARGTMQILFHNLLTNAIKYQPKNAGHRPLIEVRKESSGDDFSVLVRDNGIGIPPEFIDQLFLPFKRLHSNTEYEGTGLGLSICKRIMEKHNGKIDLISTGKGGSTFRLDFPPEMVASNVSAIIKNISA